MYAIYAETDAYVHLVSADTSIGVRELLYEDMKSVGTTLDQISILYAVKDGRFTDIELEDMLNSAIKKAREELQ